MRNIGPFGLENRIFAGLCGLAALLLSLVLFGFGFFGALVFGVIVGIIVLLWLLMQAGDATTTGATSAGTTASATTAQSIKTAAVEPVVATPTEAEDIAPIAEVDETPAATDAPSTEDVAAPKVKESAPLPGQDDLASRKGEWKYDGDDAPADAAPAAATTETPAAEPAPVAETTPAPAAAPTGDAGDVDYDGDGVIEGENEGAKPEMLTAARDGGADNLKEIKGVGPKMETMLNDMGVYHFDQVAGWSAQEVAWVDANLKGFKGRVSRDGWVDQAKILAAGGDTEFSKKVEKGGVY